MTIPAPRRRRMRALFSHPAASARTAKLARAKDGGFSFIELLAYMAIAALLILAAIPQFNKYREQAVVSTMQSDARNVSVSLEATFTNNLAYPATVTKDPTDSSGQTYTNLDSVKLSRGDVLSYVLSADSTSYVLTITNPTAAPHSTVKYDSANGGLQPTIITPGG